MVHNLPENFNISDFDVFHSALGQRDGSLERGARFGGEETAEPSH